MKKDILIPKVENIIIAIIPGDEELWDVYLVNEKNEAIRNVLITSKGYGERNGEKVKTTILRHFYEEIEAQTALKIEPIQTELFDLTNEYWISFQQGNQLYDKRYVFVPRALQTDLFSIVPIIEEKGVMIR